MKTVYNGPNTSTTISLNGPPDGMFLYASRACNSAGCSGWTNAGNYTWLKGGGGGVIQAEPAPGSSL